MIHATLHQLIVFEATARHGSFTRAAEELSITQPTVSTQMKQLTKAVGLPLFEQIGKRLYLTEAGRSLLVTCQAVLKDLDNFEMAIADIKGIKQGKLRLAAVSTAQYLIPQILGPFCQQYQGVDVSLELTNHQDLEARIINNVDDLYILSEPPQELNLDIQPFLENPLVVIARKDHPLAGQKKIPIKRLQGEPFIMREMGSGIRRAVQQIFLDHGITVSLRLEIGNNEAIKQAIAGGLGISVLSQHVLNLDPPNGEFTILDVEDFPIQRHWYVVYPKDKKLSVIAKTFLDYLLSGELGVYVPTDPRSSRIR
ncbi:HTH-type transcriptional activator CmpR [Microcystis aeruginosa TAIHU98]|uniref:HTH-type transcriptional activator CmpR n=1 Tax=Microcystis aeruginosa TAIHU98 TaxID=1134457 RepID=L7E7C6_MICAE|nr:MULTISPECIES: LysR family transcriptional regulator [Microcystis]ELP54939.1 HTH-type transcriptional activator CmpR [Microcystis aeruginosa TAIHU98]MCA2625456.1 LysR family transcriptional regulator [Microcystis sp. M19BS1]MCA2634918.1 LysR family transcriptional regulator [Microcystis sp. M20BS1]